MRISRLAGGRYQRFSIANAMYISATLISTDDTMQRRIQRTGSFPLIIVHLSFTVGVDHVHPLQERLEFLVFLELLEYLMELLPVEEMEAIF
jgi:hypothetical protein